jgi:hypothetical protein
MSRFVPVDLSSTNSILEGHVCHQDECFPTPPPQNDDNMNTMYDDDTQSKFRIMGVVNCLTWEVDRDFEKLGVDGGALRL